MDTIKFTPNNSKGYTLIEVSLFLAITGLLALIVFAGLGPRLRNVRFTQGVRATESSLTKQSANFQSGVSNRPPSACVSDQLFGYKVKVSAGTQTGGTSADCIINGRLVVLRATGLEYYPILSWRTPPSTCPTTPGLSRVLCFGPTSFDNVNIPKQTMTYPSGIANSQPAVAYGYIQDPEGSQVYGFVVPSATAITSLNDRKLVEDLNVTAAGPQSATACLFLGPRDATITYNATLQTVSTAMNSGCH